eukprot:Blabericola_migrator_1__951@NODE_1239_length_5016_cov_82_322287_g838_i0_p1_GENE_NODE_1239_length_5016_cov_82_322287_g838_i0NODE_1239_length_5016_cov_82_322287_g838_i0_p1_ORF_typecomplete_len1008_score152_42DAGK_acc/PF00609_19/3_2e42DAGK_cat/PF00781_24/1_4e25C1_1/PF00130_22/0_0019C1_1/PF00130_22/8_7e07C1_2/PF03107_16/0_00029C1_2/PF03107_16/1_8e03Zf_RING/PF16744_5/2_9Zf_RING/PF16744_5/0_023DUF2277/PF10041_9/0_41PHD_4/PF16866_5/36PHD_4/PF16866_5/0_88_NODE_1239_length_5016_cov_82_322287_g838_i038130
MACKTPASLSPIQHQFREGNLMNNSVCAFCGVICSSAFSLFGLECLWCHRTFHRPCLDQAVELGHDAAIRCDLGELVSLVLPPSAVELDDVVAAQPPEKKKPPSQPLVRKRAASAPPNSSLKRRRNTVEKTETRWRLDGTGTGRSGSEIGLTNVNAAVSGEGPFCHQSSELVKGSIDDTHLLRKRGRQMLTCSPSMRSQPPLQLRPLTEANHPPSKKELVPSRSTAATKVSPRRLDRWCLLGLVGDGALVDAHLSALNAAVTAAVAAAYTTPPSTAPTMSISENPSIERSTQVPPDTPASLVSFAPLDSPPGAATVAGVPSPGEMTSEAPPSGRTLETKARHLSERIQNFAKSFQRGVSGFNQPAAPTKQVLSDQASHMEIATAAKWLHEKTSDLLFELERYGSSPIIAFVNPKSGGQIGVTLLKDFYSLLNPWQVVNLAEEKNPREVLRRYKALAMTSRLRILVCGGDGTVSWIVNSVHEEYGDCLSFSSLYRLHQLLRKPKDVLNALSDVQIDRAIVPIAILPLGTGNDLARVLHWGGTFETTDLSSFLKRLVFARVVDLDLWTVQVEIPMNTTSKFHKKTASGVLTASDETEWKTIMRKAFTNYIDIGIAARIALKFHLLRESHPELFKSRLGNKFLYGEVGVRDFLVDQPIDLSRTEVYCDSQRLNLTREGALEGLAIVNIPSFGGGCNLWKSERSHRQRFNSDVTDYDSPFHSAESSDFDSSEDYPDLPPGTTIQNIADRKIELVAFKSLLHLGRVQVGLADSIKIGQGSEFKFIINSRVPFQVDGEPQMLGPTCRVRVFWKATVAMLSFSAPKFRTASQHGHTLKGRAGFQYRRVAVGPTVSIDRLHRILQEAVDNDELTMSQMSMLMSRLPAVA